MMAVMRVIAAILMGALSSGCGGIVDSGADAAPRSPLGTSEGATPAVDSGWDAMTCANEGRIIEYVGEASGPATSCKVCTCTHGVDICKDYVRGECPLNDCREGERCADPKLYCKVGEGCGAACKCGFDGVVHCPKTPPC